MSRTISYLRRTARALPVFLAWLTCAPAFAIPDYAMLDDLLIAHVRDGFVDYDGIALDPVIGVSKLPLTVVPSIAGSKGEPHPLILVVGAEILNQVQGHQGR